MTSDIGGTTDIENIPAEGRQFFHAVHLCQLKPICLSLLRGVKANGNPPNSGLDPAIFSAPVVAMTHELYRVIRLLEREKVHYQLDRHRDDSIMITATLVGERIEIDVFEDGHIEYSRFRGSEDVEDDVPLLETLLCEQGNG